MGLSRGRSSDWGCACGQDEDLRLAQDKARANLRKTFSSSSFFSPSGRRRGQTKTPHVYANKSEHQQELDRLSSCGKGLMMSHAQGISLKSEKWFTAASCVVSFLQAWLYRMLPIFFALTALTDDLNINHTFI